MHALKALNPEQQQAVTAIDGPLLVLAGAGSGKTSVITHKIAYLIERCGLSARHIAAVTFTNKAAKEMHQRISHKLSKQALQGLTVSTFHQLGLKMLRKHITEAGYKPGFSIFDAADARLLIKEISRQQEASEEALEALHSQISQLKNDLHTPEVCLQQAQSAEDYSAAGIYLKYQQSLRAYNALDFDDLLVQPTLLLRTYPEILTYWQQKIRYLLVDEYQDTNSCQYELVKLLVGRYGKMTVVGDDDQSIYAWRGAKPENLAQLQQDYPHLKVIKLEQNYRSTGLILKAANKVIAYNPHVFQKRLWSDMGYGESIRVIRCKNEEQEAERIAGDILEHKLRYGGRFSDYAVLFRGNFQAKPLELYLQNYQMPYRLSGGQSFFARSEIKDLMSYLKLIINPDDDAAFLRVVNVPRRQIGISTLEKLATYAKERNVSLLAACGELGLESHLPPPAVAKLQHFFQWLETLSRRTHQEDPVAVIRSMIETIDYAAWLHDNSTSAVQAEKRLKNVHYFIDSIQKMLAKAQEQGAELSFEDAVARLVLRDLLERQEEEEQLDQIQLMTLHAAKGLEFPNVYIMGLEEDLLPHRNSIDADTIEEERRLLYVGITRAMRQLTLTLAAKRRQYGEDQTTTPSRFIDELPKEDLVLEGFEQASAEKRQATGVAAITSLKNFLDL